MIPFELVGHRLEYISDYLGQESVEFLAINNHDCTHIVCYPQVGRPDEQFSNLKALTVYVSEDEPAIGGLCRLLMIRDLEFVHVEEWDDRERIDIARMILPHLGKQKNLKALTLDTNGSDSPPVGEERESLWPKLKSLYIRRANEDWFVQLPKFKELELLTLLPHRNISIFSSSILAEAVAKCKTLRSIYIPTLHLGSVNDVDHNIHVLLDIARGCPLLQKLSVADFGDTEVKEPFLLDLLKALPRLEFLKLGLVFRVYGTDLQDIAHHCPRLTFFELSGAKLYISLTQMTRTLPFRHLEIMRFENIFFKRPLHIGRGAKFQTLVTEWSRIFPKLQMMPCVNEWEMAPAMRERLDRGGNAWGSSEEEPLFPDTDDEEADIEWRWVKSKLWEALNYGDYDERTVEKRQYLWDIDLQIETIGWPVIPSAAFINPNLYSTSAHLF
ncbi:hypothetical protein BDV36DRAFT_301337 [Aspergillus pseudocaelatus]|uniref:F-box domain-containing protein n=1 Tax=Aspergillus pseudocaelatus TaxID=1825620 RepID=A0ABQ6W492_9EURO|nr:hypothetical protein BDV36DRAFT_301337 [Aspergillus pseudocaelatus]